ncbi:hypothetical protein EJ05DRAFT_518865 [Pseudovirgaria hyperparasitica]|uniref:Uncharacterized protein n=1 Tax=Pseudovirgaria hyperparasitica TaxID=470096 RepID=A0A6A6W2G4_9PEZI|nr:uncharacterized protein EJ05DRAFT_518865 [Pseudovirgaria hyperparasitica]KAF2756204.1 hypothetical protein EJ05DRAFT_518865 [Pseudovirgaria hyperparasitica]
MTPPNGNSKRQRLSCTDACCFQGAPDKCKYAGNIQGLTQAEEIRRLRKKLASLEARIPPTDRSDDSKSLTLSPEAQSCICQKLSAASLTESHVSAGPSIQHALVSSFIANACPSGHHQWIWPVAQASGDSLMLWRALTATSYADQALATGDHAMYMEAQYHYTYAVTQLRNHLQKPGHATKTFDTKSLYTMVVLEFYETIDFRDRQRWSMHIDGAGAFLQDANLGPGNDIPPAVLDFIRLMDITISCVRKQKGYFTHSRWRQATASPLDPSRPRSSIAELLDVLDRATGLIEKAHIASDAAARTQKVEEMDDEYRRADFWAELDGVEKDMIRFIETNDHLKGQQAVLTQHVDELSIVIACAFRLIMSRIDTRPWRPSEKERVDLAALLVKRVVRLTNERSDKTSGVILLFTLRPAFFTFPEHHPGRQLTKHILANLSQKFRLQVANNVIDMFPPVVTPDSSPSPQSSHSTHSNGREMDGSVDVVSTTVY